jgi:hypothetical protein
MSLTAHDILMDADLFKRSYPRWPSTAPYAWPADPDERCPNGCGHLVCCPCGCCGGGD